MGHSATRRVVFLTTASTPKPPWTEPIPPLPPERAQRSVLKVSASPSKSAIRLQSARTPSNSTCRALIVAQAPVKNVDRTSYEGVSLHTCLTQQAPPPHTTPSMPLRVAHPGLEDDNYARPQHQRYSNARPAPPQTISNPTIGRQSTSTYEPTANDFSNSNTSPVYLQDLDNLTDLFGASHDEYSLYNDLYTTTTTTDNTVSMYPSNISDPFIESATIPAMASTMGCTAPTRAISSEEEILANVDLDLYDLEKDVDIGQWMKYLQDDSPTVPGFEESIFERVDEPNTPETIPETTQFNDYFAVPSTSGFVAPTSVTAQSDLDPVQEFFPEMCVEVSSTTTTGFDVYDNQAMYPEWQPYEQYSPSHTPASVDSSNSSSTSWSQVACEPKISARKRPYPAPSVSTFSTCDDDYRCKRDKNNKASQISRQKHKEKVDREKKESVELVARNEILKMEVDTLEQQIATMRAVLMDSIATAQK